MKHVIHRADTRGHADHGWLNTYHTFSFANYYDPDRTHFGALRVLNDDVVAPGMGFGTHPHQNMEIVSIPLKGQLEHKDNMGNGSVIEAGDIQHMSAGTGVQHSEFNPSPNEEVNFLQIWIFPKEKDITPRYDQRKFSPDGRQDQWQVVVSPNEMEESLFINQEAWFSLVDISEGKELNYDLHGSDTGVYFFILEGSIQVGGSKLNRRDGIGVWDTKEVEIQATSGSRILAIEVPMKFSL